MSSRKECLPISGCRHRFIPPPTPPTASSMFNTESELHGSNAASSDPEIGNGGVRFRWWWWRQANTHTHTHTHTQQKIINENELKHTDTR